MSDDQLVADIRRCLHVTAGNWKAGGDGQFVEMSRDGVLVVES